MNKDGKGDLGKFQKEIKNLNKPNKLKVDLAELITFENYYKQFLHTFFGVDALNKEQDKVIKTTFFSGAACLNMIIEMLNRMKITPEEKERVLAKVLVELEFYYIEPTEDAQKQ